LSDDQATFFEFPSLTDIPLHVQEVSDLQEMFEHSPGWKVFTKILRREASKAGSESLNPDRDEKQREKSMVEFYAYVYALQFPAHIEAGMKDTTAKTREELMIRQDPTLLDLVFNIK
jgi:hypothetical protein